MSAAVIVNVRRLIIRGRCYLGTLAFDGEEPTCFTLEDLPRAVKVARETCIPAGRYELKLRTFGRLFEHYKARFSWNAPGMLWLQAVPQFSDVLIHPGNTDRDTHGCLLVGERIELERVGIWNSVSAYKRVYLRISKVLESGFPVAVVISEANQ